jgi:hypothetical protein
MRKLSIALACLLGCLLVACRPCTCSCPADMPAAPDLAQPEDLWPAPDLACESRIGKQCGTTPCCAPLTCVGGACADVARNHPRERLQCV